jgi:hypothetical protein
VSLGANLRLRGAREGRSVRPRGVWRKCSQKHSDAALLREEMVSLDILVTKTGLKWARKGLVDLSTMSDRSTALQVLPHSVVDNSDCSPTRLTVLSNSSYDEETFHATHFKQRGFLWPFMSSCSCS